MNDREKLDKINKVSHAIWDWMMSLDTAIVSLIPPIEKIMELSQPSEGSPT